MIAKFKTADGWRIIGSVEEINTLSPDAAAKRRAADEPDYKLGVDCTSDQCKLVDLLIDGSGWLTVEYSSEAYLCTDRGETINAI